MALTFDLWTLLVNQLIGSFALTVVVLMVILFFIMGWLGKMSRISVIYFEALFFMTMMTGFGYKMFSILVGFALLVWLYLEVRNTTSG
jgi:hypothetical protein